MCQKKKQKKKQLLTILFVIVLEACFQVLLAKSKEHLIKTVMPHYT